MASVSTADTWREAGPRADRRAGARPEAADYVSRIGRPPVPPPPPRMRAGLPPFPEDMARSAHGDHMARSAHGRDDRRPPLHPRPSGERAARPSREVGRGRPVPSDADRPRVREDRSRDLHASEGSDDADDRRRGARAPEPRSTPRRPAGRGATAQAPESGSGLRGAVAVLAVFLVTLAGAALESWIGAGLGLATLGTLAVASAVATVAVRRADLFTTVVAPPLVYIAVAVLNTALAPSAPLNLASVATLLIRGFPAMVVATAAAAVVALIRWAARR
ncbi:DUF6542 domain-containing protein [Geodermatophilus obscurus]|uniref:DUF6542 domain-containing protein n=1 Tax=Geodermatophilus obscurus (strain ATCC 25078 / DSM 43160 / JCM 3152 / CCUG 61914 / KCC A-0152 / KCTC 9177 / NBRC 13315 / NRRL B-3577 / G-20) TaxID=526225 RepID=D2S9Q7_GEOOG|nr:DUF6542 domain-containing protein [Geodermatophilus obscurus]ADB73770.1 hypothetical protein Gobs_1009 [Geodermatophilus obscurus DSM 43160]